MGTGCPESLVPAQAGIVPKWFLVFAEFFSKTGNTTFGNSA
jgi:hypothetical protein